MSKKYIRISYCTSCRSLVFEKGISTAKYGRGYFEIDDDGKYIETDFDVKDVEEFDDLCLNCGSNITDEIDIPRDVFKKIREEVIRKEETNYYLPLDLDTITRENIRVEILSSLI